MPMHEASPLMVWSARSQGSPASSAGSGGDDGLVVDYQGNPVEKTRTGGWFGAFLILGTELSERICVVGISANLVTYLVGELHLSVGGSATLITNFLGTLYLFALAGGFLADAKLGRYRTIVVSACVATVGVALLTIDATVPSLRPPTCDNPPADGCVPASRGQLVPFYIALYAIAAGAGGLKANVSGFGSDQFDLREPREERAMHFFFNRFYLCISLGSLLASTVLVYLQENVGRGWGYGASAVVMLLALAVIVGGRSWYRYRRPAGSPLTVLRKVLWMAWLKRRQPLPADVRDLHGFSAANVARTDRLRWLEKAAIVVSTADPTGHVPHQPTMSEVEEVKMVIMLIPVWCTSIIFWTLHSQLMTFSIDQAVSMNLQIPPGGESAGFSVLPGSLSALMYLSIILVTSLNQHVIVPLAARLTHRPDGISSLQRAGSGLFLAVVGIAVAGIVEKKRREAAAVEEILSVLWLVPQFFLVGAGEALAYVGQLEFFICESPESMKSMSTGLFLMAVSLGFYLSSLLVFLVERVTRGAWIGDDLNNGRLDLFYFMLAVLGTANIIMFVVAARNHRYKNRIVGVVVEVEEDMALA